MPYEDYAGKLRDTARDKIADKVTDKVAPHVTGELVKFSDADEADVREFISDGTKIAFDVATGTKTFDETTAFARDKTRDKIAGKVTEKVAPHVTGELVKLSEAAHETAYKVTYELAEVALPPELSRKVGRQLRISTEQIKRKHADNLNDAAVEILSASTKTLFDAATGTKDFDEACEEIFSQTKVTVKNVVIERGKQVALDEAKRIGGQVVGNAAIEMLILGNQMKDSVLRLLDGEIDLERYIFEVNRACLALAIKLVEKNSLKLGQGLIPIPVVGALVGSAVISVACRGLMIAADAVLTKVEDGVRQVKKMWNAADNQAAADRRKVVDKIKSDALAEMNRQRAVMQKYFADEKLTWDSNVKAGFELIASGTYSNDVEVIAQGLDKILQNFGSRVAFDNREDFRKKFRQRKIVVNL